MGSRGTILCMVGILVLAHDSLPAFLSHDQSFFFGNEFTDRWILQCHPHSYGGCDYHHGTLHLSHSSQRAPTDPTSASYSRRKEGKTIQNSLSLCRNHYCEHRTLTLCSDYSWCSSLIYFFFNFFRSRIINGVPKNGLIFPRDSYSSF